MGQSTGNKIVRANRLVKLVVSALLSLFVLLRLASAADDSTEIDQYTIAGHLIFATSPLVARDQYGDYRKLTARSNIFVADTLKLRLGNQGQFRLRDGAIFEISDRAELTVSDFSPHEGNILARSVLFLHRGRVQFFVGLETQDSPSLRIIKTPVGWLETENGMFSVSLNENGQMDVRVSSGQVRVSNPKGALTIGDDQSYYAAQVSSLSAEPRGKRYTTTR